MFANLLSTNVTKIHTALKANSYHDIEFRALCVHHSRAQVNMVLFQSYCHYHCCFEDLATDGTLLGNFASKHTLCKVPFCLGWKERLGGPGTASKFSEQMENHALK